MTTDRIIYQSESLYTSKLKGTGSGTPANIVAADIKEINRVQDMSYSLEVSRTDINEFGQLAALSREVTEPPTVSLDFSYLITNGEQDERLGLFVNKKATFPIDATSSSFKPLTANLVAAGSQEVDELNYYIVTVPEGDDVHSATEQLNQSDNGVIAIGNGFITSYGISGAVGELASASVSVEASNILFKSDLSSAVANPSIDINSDIGAKLSNTVNFASVLSGTGDIYDNSGLEVYAIRPGDITLDFDAHNLFNDGSTKGDLDTGGARLPGSGSALGANETTIHLQNFSLDLPVSRTGLSRLGNHYAFARKVDFPVTMSLSVSALATDITDGSLDQLICNAEEKRDIAIKLKTRCGDAEAITYVMRNAILDTQAFSASIGDNKTVDLTFSCQIGGANDLKNGIFAFSEPVNQGVDYGTGVSTAITPTPTPA